METLSPLTPAELVDLAGDADVCSRLVLEGGGAQPWELRHGPFELDLLELMVVVVNQPRATGCCAS